MGQIYLIRHGQASASKRNYDALSEQGIAQAKVLGETLKARGVKPDRVICGAMTRHAQTAEHCLASMGLPCEWQEDTRWNEYDHQELIIRHKPLYRSRTLMMADMARTLRPKEAFQVMFEEALERWLLNEHKAEYREPWDAYKKRINDALSEAVKKNQGTTLVFTSGGAISASVVQLWRVPDMEWIRLGRVIANGALTKVLVGKRGVHLSTFNEHSHFEGENQSLLSYR